MMSNMKIGREKFKTECKYFKNKIVKNMTIIDSITFYLLFCTINLILTSLSICMCSEGSIKYEFKIKFLFALSILLLIRTVCKKVSRWDYFVYWTIYFLFAAFCEM